MSDIHQLLKESIDKIAGQWVAELNTLRNNASLLEQQGSGPASPSERLTSRNSHDLGIQVAEEGPARAGTDSPS